MSTQNKTDSKKPMLSVQDRIAAARRKKRLLYARAALIFLHLGALILASVMTNPFVAWTCVAASVVFLVLFCVLNEEAANAHA